MSIEERIREIEEEIRKTKYNKATEAHIAKLRAKLAVLKEMKKGKKGKSGVKAVRKHGDACVAIVGMPSTGKSTLLNALTNANSKVADYNFTTLDIVPGMMKYNGASIQLLDVPGIIENAHKGVGMGAKILSFMRMADLLLIVADEARQFEIVEKELHSAGFRLNKTRADVKVVKKHGGGINITIPKGSKVKKEEISEILKEMKIYNADVIARGEFDYDDLIDAVFKNRVYVSALRVLNKVDLMSPEMADNLCRKYKCIPVSAKKKVNLENLREAIWKKLGLKRIYLKKIGGAPDMEEPLVLRGNVTVEDVLKKVFPKFRSEFKYAKVWGSSPKFPGQRVGIEHELIDGDIVELHVG